MFQRLVHDWDVDREQRPGDDAPRYTPAQTAEKVKRFYGYYALNRHKMTVITPAVHCTSFPRCNNLMR